MIVLENCQKLMRYLHLCKYKSTFSLGEANLPNILVQLLYILPMYVSIFGLIQCVFYIRDLKQILTMIYPFIGSMSIVVIYVSLIAKNSLIEVSVSELQAMVKQRKL